jgi:hypothetical protein
MNDLGKKLRELRGTRSYQEIANLLNLRIGSSFLKCLETGVTDRGNAVKARPEQLKELADLYEMDYDELARLAGVPNEACIFEEDCRLK